MNKINIKYVNKLEYIDKEIEKTYIKINKIEPFYENYHKIKELNDYIKKLKKEKEKIPKEYRLFPIFIGNGKIIWV